MYNIPTKFDGTSTLPAAEFNSMTSELENIIISGGLILSGADTSQIAKSVANYVANGQFYVDSGTANAYVLGVVGSKNTPTSYQNGLTATFKVGNTNTGAATANIAGLGVKNIKKNNGASDVAAGDLTVNKIVTLIYDSGGDYLELVSTEFIAADFLRKDTTANISVGYTYTTYAIGNSGTGTITPSFANGPFQTMTINGSFTLAAPITSNAGYLEIIATNDATGGYSITTSAYTTVQNNYDNSANAVNIIRIEKVGSTSYLTINPVPIAAGATQITNYNAIINGSMDLWQRGTSFTSATDGLYTSDRWRYTKLVTTGVQNITQSSSVPTPDSNTPLLNYSLLVTNTSSDASVTAGKLVTIAQRIEGSNFLPLAQRAMTLSFWVNSSVTGTYCVGITNSGGDRSYVAEYIITNANTWQRVTITIPASPSSGTWNYTNGTGLNLNFTLMCGSTYQTASGSWTTGNYFGSSNQTNFLATNGATFYLTCVQLEQGSIATPYKGSDIEDTISKCQRYFFKSFLLTTAPASNTDSSTRYNFPNTNTVGSTAVTPSISLPVRMRTTPTIVTYNPFGAGSEISDGVYTATSTATYTASEVNLSLSYTVPTGASIGTNFGYHVTATAEL